MLGFLDELLGIHEEGDTSEFVSEVNDIQARSPIRISKRSSRARDIFDKLADYVCSAWVVIKDYFSREDDMLNHDYALQPPRQSGPFLSQPGDDDDPLLRAR